MKSWWLVSVEWLCGPHGQVASERAVGCEAIRQWGVTWSMPLITSAQRGVVGWKGVSWTRWGWRATRPLWLWYIKAEAPKLCFLLPPVGVRGRRSISKKRWGTGETWWEGGKRGEIRRLGGTFRAFLSCNAQVVMLQRKKFPWMDKWRNNLCWLSLTNI